MNVFFLIGPLRSGSSLFSRCIDDHPDAINLCETEINRTLFRPYHLGAHHARMLAHGFDTQTVLELAQRKPQENYEAFYQWYVQVFERAKILFKKPNAKIIGDKSPNFFESPILVEALAQRAKLIYTTRDPRAIYRSILYSQNDGKHEQRYQALVKNFEIWERHLDNPNILSSRFEDLITSPIEEMQKIYAHLGLKPSARFMQSFQRLSPQRFLWQTVVDPNSGNAVPFDVRRRDIKDSDIPYELNERIRTNPAMHRYCERFGYQMPQAVHISQVA